MNDISDINLDYKALYEAAKAKLDKIEWAETKEKIAKRLELGYAFGSPAYGDDLRELLKKNKLISLLGHHRLSEEKDEVVNQYGFDVVVKAIREYVEELDKTPEAEEEK